MSEMNVRSDSVDVEQIMRQIRARIREKRGADYTETELQQLANVKLEKFLDPRGIRSDLVAEYKRTRVASPLAPKYEFGEETLYETHRGFLQRMRERLKPILKLFFNPDTITNALHIQTQVNAHMAAHFLTLESREPLTYELLHNLTVEITRLGIDVHNLKMRVESLSSRADFDERRAKALEGVVQYRTPAPPRPQVAQPAPQAASPAPLAAPTAPTPTMAPDSSPATPSPRQPDVPGTEGASAVGGDKRRRRRRRRRRPGGTMADSQGQNGARDSAGAADTGDSGGTDDAGDDGPDGDGPDSSDAADQ